MVLAEDNQVNRLFLRHFLQEAGCEVRCAGTSAEVLDLLAASPALVSMDIQMPEMGGVAATRVCGKARPGRGARHLPVVALTAYSMKGDRERFLAAGLDDYVSKPVDVEELFTVMRRVLRERTRPTGWVGKRPSRPSTWNITMPGARRPLPGKSAACSWTKARAWAKPWTRPWPGATGPRPVTPPTACSAWPCPCRPGI